MNDSRPIRLNERELINFLLSESSLKQKSYTIPDFVSEYEGGIMGSIGMGVENTVYAGDIIQAKYIDLDHITVIITLTKDADNKLLDLDFWKEDFSKLIAYPLPEQLILLQ